MPYYPPVSPYRTGFANKCPRCGRGDLYKTYLKLDDHCAACGLDYAEAEQADGPAIFIMFIVGFVAISVMFILRYGFELGMGFAFLMSLALSGVLSLMLLRPLKSILIALQYQHKAGEGSVDQKHSFGDEKE